VPAAAERAPRPEAKRSAAAPAAGPRPAAPRPAAPAPAPAPAAVAPADDDVEVLPDDDDLEAVLEEVTGGGDEAAAAPPVPPAPVAPPPAARAGAPVASPPAARVPAPAQAKARAAPSPARAPAPAAPPAAPPLAAAPAPAPLAEPEAPDLLSAPEDELVGPLDVVADDGGALEIEVAAPPAEFDGALTGGEGELELDSGELEGLGDVDLGNASDFAAGVDGEPMIGGAAEFSEGDFAAPAAEEDPNAKTQPDLEAESGGAPAAPAGGEPELFGEAGVDLSLFGDDGEEGR